MQLNKTPSATEFQSINQNVWDAQKLVEQDGDKELIAVMKEFCDKSEELQQCIQDDANSNEIMEKIIEVEQAADSALKASKASGDDEVIQKVQESHDRVKEFKERYLS